MNRAWALALLVACSSSNATREGLVVVLSSDGLFGTDFDSVRLSVNGIAVDTSKVTDLPTSVVVSGKAGAQVVVEARAIKGGLLRIASVRTTTIPRGHAAVFEVALSLACYDRCAQLPADGTIARVCDPDGAAGATCIAPPSIAVDSLPAYANDVDPLVKIAAAPKGCAKPYCSMTATCADVEGVMGAGAIVCDKSCRAIDPQTSCASPVLAKGWPTIGGTATGTRRSDEDGPHAAPGDPATIALPMGPRGVMGTPVVSPDGKLAYATLGTGSFSAGAIARFDLAASTSTLLPLPNANDVSALYGMLDTRSAPAGIHCCDFWSAPVLAADGHLLAVSTSGVLLDWANPATNAPPAVSWIFKTAVELAQQGGDFSLLAPCFDKANGAICTHGGLVLAPDGSGYVGTFFGLFGLDPNRKTKWGPLRGCPSDAAVPAVGADGRIYIGRTQPFDGICVVKPDGRSRVYQGEDNVFGVVQGTAVGLGNVVYFGTSNYRLHARSDTSAWDVSLDGPVSSAPAIGADGTIYAVTSLPNPALHAVDPLGRRKWTVALRGGFDIHQSPVIGRDGTIYVVNAGGFVTAFEPNGLVRWESGNGDPFQGSPVLSANRLLAMHVDRLEIFAEAGK